MYFYKGLLPPKQVLYTDQRYKNMAVILNGTSEAYGHYGYQYGYRYGYNYGYGKGYSEEN